MEEKQPISPDQVGKNVRIINRTGWPTCSSLCYEEIPSNYRTRPHTESDLIGTQTIWDYDNYRAA